MSASRHMKKTPESDTRRAPIQHKQGTATTDVMAAAEHGLTGGGGGLPFAERIQHSFGRHSVAGVVAHTGGAARQANESMGSMGYATGNHVAFRGAPDLHTAAHEAAHVIQQRAGVSLKGGVGESGDRYERHADAVAERVVQGKSAEDLLEQYAGGGAGHAVQQRGVQHQQRGSNRSRNSVRNTQQTNQEADMVFSPEEEPPVVGEVNWRGQASQLPLIDILADRIKAQTDALAQTSTLPTRLVDIATIRAALYQLPFRDSPVQATFGNNSQTEYTTQVTFRLASRAERRQLYAPTQNTESTSNADVARDTNTDRTGFTAGGGEVPGSATSGTESSVARGRGTAVGVTRSGAQRDQVVHVEIEARATVWESGALRHLGNGGTRDTNWTGMGRIVGRALAERQPTRPTTAPAPVAATASTT